MKKLIAAPAIAAFVLAGCGSSHHHYHPSTVVTHVHVIPHSHVTHHVVHHNSRPRTIKQKVHSLTKKH